MNILVTGASGFIGSHFCYYFSRKGHKIFTIERSLKPGWWIEDALKFSHRTYGHINEYTLEDIISSKQIDTIVHFAALSTVKGAKDSPKVTFKNNIEIALDVLEAGRVHDLKVILQSTDKVYGEKTDAKPTDRLNPSEPYATSKVCTDMIGQSFKWTYDMDATIVRPCNVYGYDLNNRIIPNTIRKCLDAKKPFIYLDDPSTRQYLHVWDLVRAYNVILDRPTPLIVNVASKDGVYNQKEIVEMICKKFNIQPTYKLKNDTRQLKDQSIVSSLQLWSPRITLDYGLTNTIARFEYYGY